MNTGATPTAGLDVAPVSTATKPTTEQQAQPNLGQEEEDRKKKETAEQQRQAAIQSFRIESLTATATDDFLERFEKLDAVKKQQFRDEWTAAAGAKIIPQYEAMPSQKREILFSGGPT